MPHDAMPPSRATESHANLATLAGARGWPFTGDASSFVVESGARAVYLRAVDARGLALLRSLHAVLALLDDASEVTLMCDRIALVRHAPGDPP